MINYNLFNEKWIEINKYIYIYILKFNNLITMVYIIINLTKVSDFFYPYLID